MLYTQLGAESIIQVTVVNRLLTILGNSTVAEYYQRQNDDGRLFMALGDFERAVKKYF